MDPKSARTAAAKAFKTRGVPLRKGHWRLAHDELTWFVDLRSDGPGRDAALRFEVGAWLPALTTEPEGGAIDCSLLTDVPLDGSLDRPADVAAQVDAIVDRLQAISDPAALADAVRSDAFPGAHVDRVLREHLGL